MLAPIDRSTETELQEAVDRSELEAHVDAFADLRRYPGTDDQWTAAEYVVETLDGYGVDAALETVTGYTSVPENASVTVTSPVRREIDDAITTAFSASTPVAGVSGAIVRVEALPDDAEALAHVSGKVVFTRGLPSPEPVRRLEAAGAAAVIFESPTPGHLHEMVVSPVWGTPSVDEANELPSIPVAEIHRSDGEWLADRLASGRVEATVETQTATEVRELPCPVATVEGTESDRYFLVGNHIDSWHEGVTDNATAMAASMELARVFADSPPKRGVVFGFWPGHSMGRYAGSAEYADRNWLDLRENGVAYLHADLNGLDGADRLWFQHMAEVEDEHLDVLEQGPLPLGTESGDGTLIDASDRPGRNSDQSFWGTGLSSLLSGARFSASHEEGGPIGGGWWWHTPADTRDKVDFDLLVDEVELYVALVSRFANSTVLPRDFRATAAEIRSVLGRIEDGTDDAVDFGPVYERLDRLDDRLDAFTAHLDALEQDGIAREATDVQVELGNLLIPALYVESSEFGHDPALPHELLPYLRVAEELPERTGARERFARTTVDRGVARLAHRVATAADTVESFLDESG